MLEISRRSSARGGIFVVHDTDFDLAPSGAEYAAPTELEGFLDLGSKEMSRLAPFCPELPCSFQRYFVDVAASVFKAT
jgi:hypothetical protein